MEEGRRAFAAFRDDLAASLLSGELAPLDFGARFSDWLDSKLSDLFTELAGGDVAGICLLAVGSYGRRQLAPGSDLDLLVCHEGSRPAGQLADALWYELWDTGVPIDHALRTPEEALALAREDLQVQLGLLDGRVVAGALDLGERLLAGARRSWQAHRSESVRRLELATSERQASAGELACLVEPDLKDSAGGLRDLAAISALRAAVPLLPSPSGLERIEEHEKLIVSVRAVLQARTGNRSNRLVLEEQADVALRLGFETSDALAGALASAGRQISYGYEQSRRRALSMTEGPARRSSSRLRPLGAGAGLLDGEVVATSLEAQLDALSLLRLARASAEGGFPLADRTVQALASSHLDLEEPWRDQVREEFVSLLGSGRALIGVVESLDQNGLFEKLLPEWALVRHRPQRNSYHRYTLDRHLLETVAEASQLVRRVERPDLLLVAALLHDMGKALPGDHSHSGARLASRIAERMNFARRDVSVLERIVRHHLLLADTATRRDIEDEETLELVAEALGDRLSLELLAALTRADSKATGPAAWSEWKETLIEELVGNVSAFLSKRGQGEATEAPPAGELLVRAESGALSVEAGERQVSVVAPDRPGLFAVVTGVLALHGFSIRRARLQSLGAVAGREMAAELFDLADAPGAPVDAAGLAGEIGLGLDNGDQLATRLRAVEESYALYRRPSAASRPEPRVIVDPAASLTSSLLEVRAEDSRGLLHRLARAIDEAGLDVVSARIDTLGHEVVDAFYLRDRESGGRPTDSQLTHAVAGLEKAAAGWG